jgi:Domain of unknown function (DUF2828)
MSFANAVRNNVPAARTTNGMRANASTSSAVLDFFGEVGSARGKDASASFFSALAENENLAVRTLLWARDVREGAGERGQFRNILAKLDSINPALAGRIMHKVPFLGRWDDLFAYTDYANRRSAFDMIKAALDAGDGLAAKWMPRKGPIAVELTRHFGLTPKQYRKLIVGLTNVVENQMCAKQWNEINFSHVPSVASARYQKAFGRNASEAYSAYIAELKKPQSERAVGVKINAGAVYPHDVVKSVFKGDSSVADEQWNALPNYVGDARILPMVDVSGSMGSFHYGQTGKVQPIEVAVALGLYTSGKNTGVFKDIFLTFSNRPEFVTVSGSLSQRIQKMSTSAWEMNTNLIRAFEEILTVAQRGRVRAEDMPEVLLILSDMQFDQCARYDDSAMQMIARKFEQAGYAIPKIIFWNLNSGYGNTPVQFDSRGVCQVSGFSPSIMKSVLANDLEDYTPYNVMLKTLEKDRYAY